MRHSSKTRLNNQKNWRWNNQTWSRKRIVINNLSKKKFKSHFSDHISHFETRCKTRYQHTFAANRFNIHYSKQNLIKKSSLIRIHRNCDSFTKSHQIVSKKRLLRVKKFIIVMFSKKNNSQTKRLFSFIIACHFKNLNTIQFFHEIKRRNRLTLKDFHYIFQNVIAAR
jgi:hypothetical protein